MFNSRIGYVGKVTIKIKNKPPIRKKNRGTLALFKLLGNVLDKIALSSNYNLAQKLPTYVDILNSDGSHIKVNCEEYNSELKPNSLLRAPILLTNEHSTCTNDPVCKVSYTATLTTANMNLAKLESASASTNIHACLVDAAQSNVLAYVEISLNDLQNLSTDLYGQATLTWDMELGNNMEA